MPRLLEKYIRREILSGFLFSLSVFTGVLLMQRALDLSDLVIARGVGLTYLFQVILFTLPSLLWVSIPMAFLMATLVGLGRLSADNEIVAMQSVGVGPLSFLRPILRMGALLSLLCFAIGTTAIPWGGTALNRLIYRILQESATSGIQEKVFNDGFAHLVIYADQVDPRKNQLNKVIIADYRGDLPESIIAQTGQIQTDSKTLINTLYLSDGAVHQFDMTTGRYRLIRFQEYTVSLSNQEASLDLLEEMAERNPAQMTLPELRAAMTNGDPALSRRLRIQFHEKFAISFSCVIFGLFSIPLGIRLKRTGKFIGLSWSLLVIFFYYILLGISRNLGYEGTLNPGLAAWLPNLFFFLTGAVLFFQTSRRIPAGTAAGTRLGRMLQKIGRTGSTGGTGQP